MNVMQKEAKGSREVEEVIGKAIKKVGGRKENELCKYLPIKSGGYMHHFTLRKMKAKQPQELAVIIDKHILQVDKPPVIAPKQRAPRGSRKKRDHMNFTRSQLERMLSIARQAGDKEIITLLNPKRSLAACKRELIQAVRHNKVETDLWNHYVEAVQAQQAASALEQAIAQG